jgi:hypothetical protein
MKNPLSDSPSVTALCPSWRGHTRFPRRLSAKDPETILFMSLYHNPRFRPAWLALEVRDLMPRKSPSEAVPESTVIAP